MMRRRGLEKDEETNSFEKFGSTHSWYSGAKAERNY